MRAKELEKLAAQYAALREADIAKGNKDLEIVSRLRGIDIFKIPGVPDRARFFPEVPREECLDNQQLEVLLESAEKEGLWFQAPPRWAKENYVQEIVRYIKPAEKSSNEPLIALDFRSAGFLDYPKGMRMWNKVLEFGDKISVERFIRFSIEVTRGKIKPEEGKSLIARTDMLTTSQFYYAALKLSYNSNIHGWELSAVPYPTEHSFTPKQQLVVALRPRG
jgi:hypothetical protein